MDNPFQQPKESNGGWRGKLGEYVSFFVEQSPADEKEESLAPEVLSWMRMPYHSKFMEYLEKEIDKPIPHGVSHGDLIAGTVRANTFKEIRQHLLNLRSRSEQEANNAG